MMPRIVRVQCPCKTEEFRISRLCLPGKLLDDVPHRPRTESVVAAAPIAVRDEDPATVVACAAGFHVVGNRRNRRNVQKDGALAVAFAANVGTPVAASAAQPKQEGYYQRCSTR